MDRASWYVLPAPPLCRALRRHGAAAPVLRDPESVPALLLFCHGARAGLCDGAGRGRACERPSRYCRCAATAGAAICYAACDSQRAPFLRTGQRPTSS